MSLTDDPDFQALMRRVALIEARCGWVTEETAVSLTPTEKASMGLAAPPPDPLAVNVNPDLGRVLPTIPTSTPVSTDPVSPATPVQAPAG